MKIFLGGTCNNSKWREDMIKYLDDAGIDYFNPVVENWTDEAQANEIRERKECDICLYVITPRMKGVFSIAEVVDDSCKKPEKTILILLKKELDLEFLFFEWASLESVAKIVSRNGGYVYYSLIAAVLKIIDIHTESYTENSLLDE